MSAKQKDIYSANSTEQRQHRVTHSPTRVKWAVFRNTRYKGLSRHQKNCDYIWIQLSTFKMPFYGHLLQKSGVPSIMIAQGRHTCFLALALTVTVLLLTEELKSFQKPGLRTPSEHIHFACVSAVPHHQHKKMTQGQHQLQLQMILALCVCVQNTDSHRHLHTYVNRVFLGLRFLYIRFT